MDDFTRLPGSVQEHFSLFLAVSRVGMWELDPATGEAWRNARHDAIFGYAVMLPEWTYEMFLDHVVEEDRSRIEDLYGQALADGSDWSFECRIRRADGARRWIAVDGRHLAEAGGQGRRLIGHVLDITENKEREERLQMINLELNHRMGNLVAVVQGMLRMSARHAGDVQTLQKSLHGRLAALSAIYKLAAKQDGRSMRLVDLVAAEMRPFEFTAERVRVSADAEYRIGGVEAERLSMVLHELATNAIKYGALSNEAGWVTVDLDGDDRRLRLVWREHGGPPVRPPEGSGFGTQVLRGAMLGEDAELDLSFRPEGVECKIALPRRIAGA